MRTPLLVGNVVPSTDRYLLVNASYRSGSSVIDFTDPTNPQEIAFHDRVNADTWSAYWYESAPMPQGSSLAVYSSDGVHDPATGGGGSSHLDPEVREQVVPVTPRRRG